MGLNDLVTNDMENSEVRSAAFVSLIPSKGCFPALSQALPEFRGDATWREKCGVRALLK